MNDQAITPRPRGRLRAALRTIQAAYRVHSRWALHQLPIRGDEGDILGYLDVVEADRGTMRVAGWTTLRALRVSTEAETLDFSPDLARDDVPVPAARGFDLRVAGASRMSLAANGAAPLDVHAAGATRRIANLARLGRVLASVLVHHGRDILAYAAQGDSTAGGRLEAFLVPPAARDPIPTAAPGLFAAAERSPERPCDIIVPVYDGHDDLVRCLEALAAHTGAEHRVILIDDASPDARILPLLRAFRDARPGTDLIEEPANRGFIASVNRGLSCATRDVILLNTDAFVPPGWVGRLTAPLGDRGVASVTPMSNNAEIFTAPVECRPVELPPARAEAMDRAAARLAPGAAEADAPTGVGFCMALARDWLETVPEFDTAFGRGYGEEVDWCRKTAARGGRHLVTGQLFVEHRGGGSFGPEKAARVAENNERIARRYPGYDALVSEFRRSDPVVGPRLALGMASLQGDRPVPVYLAHRTGGGADRWLSRRLAECAKDGAGAVVVRHAETTDTAILELHAEAGVTRGRVTLADLPGYLGLLSTKAVVYSCLVGAPDPLDLIETVAGTRGPDDTLEIMFHDFFPLCPSYNLIGSDGAFCDLPGPDACQACYVRLSNLTGARPATIADWRRSWREVLDDAERITVFSEDSRARVRSVWPDLSHRIQVEAHGALHAPDAVQPKPGARAIGVLGAIGYPKGAGVLQDLACAHPDLNLVIIGRLDPAYSDPAITVHGAYDPGDIGVLAERYGVGRWFLPSIWPETYSFTVRECLATGLPVTGFDLGAQAEALRSHPNGTVLPLAIAIDDLAHALRL